MAAEADKSMALMAERRLIAAVRLSQIMYVHTVVHFSKLWLVLQMSVAGNFLAAESDKTMATMVESCPESKVTTASVGPCAAHEPTTDTIDANFPGVQLSVGGRDNFLAAEAD